jgi:hypothetical protein
MTGKPMREMAMASALGWKSSPRYSRGTTPRLDTVEAEVWLLACMISMFLVEKDRGDSNAPGLMMRKVKGTLTVLLIGYCA